MTEDERPPRVESAGGWTAPGRLVVTLMMAFAVLVVSGFWIYWGLSNRPFRELQAAILAEYPQTFPQAAGGEEQVRGRTGPMTLRVVVRTLDFDPNAETERATELADRIEILAREHVDFAGYEQFETVLFRTYKERRAEYWTRMVDLTGQSQTTR